MGGGSSEVYCTLQYAGCCWGITKRIGPPPSPQVRLLPLSQEAPLTEREALSRRALRRAPHAPAFSFVPAHPRRRRRTGFPLAMACNCFATNQQDIDELMRAASIGNEEYIRSALRTPALLTAQDRFGQTAVHWAAYRGQLHILRMLVEAGGSLTQRDNDGRVALHWAVRKDRTRCVRYIVSVGPHLIFRPKGRAKRRCTRRYAGNMFNVKCCSSLARSGAFSQRIIKRP